MGYSKVNNTNKKSVTYLNKNYNDFKQSLVDYAKNYFPNAINDFSETSPGTMFIEMAAYVGDVLSFYLDTQIQENFIQYARERENLYSLAYNLGYVPAVTSPSSVFLDVYQQIPSKVVGGTTLPDFDYALRINRNSTFLPNTNSTVSFLIQDAIDFSFSSSYDPTDISVYQIDAVTGQPEYYLLKKQVKAISAELKTQTISVGSPTKFYTIDIQDANIISIESIVDSDGNTWYEVPYLAQETIFEDVPNVAANDPELNQYNNQTPYLLRIKKVPKRFVSRFKSTGILQLQFGAGATSGDDEEIIPNPDNIGEGITDGRSLLDFAFDPSNFLFTKAYGEVPSNTTLTITYMVGGGLSSNVDSNLITRKGTISTTPTAGNLDSSVLTTAINSIAVNNSVPATGGGAGDSVEDIRLNAVANFSAQQRTVTKDDYLFRTLAMPSKFGKVAKVYIIQDNQISVDSGKRISNPNALNLYTLGYDINKNLTTLSVATKENLATYLDQYRMLTDSINIKDGYVINIGVDFDIVVATNFNNEEVLINCIDAMKNYFNIDRWQINQPIVLGEIANTLYQVPGVQTVTSINVTNKAGESLGYSKYKYDLDSATVNGVIYPSQDPSIFEVKYPNTDIKGRVNRV
jgi:hypothetical protein